MCIRDSPRIFVNLSSPPPPIHEEHRTESPFSENLWSWLYKRRDEVCVVTSMSILRRSGAAISRRLSFESTVEDFCSEMHRFPPVVGLSLFSHLFIRIGMVGIVHIHRNRYTLPNPRHEGYLYFDPYAKEGLHRNEELEGYTLGKNTILLSSILLALENSTDQFIRRKTVSAIASSAIHTMQHTDDEGYDIGGGAIGKFARNAKSIFDLYYKDNIVHAAVGLAAPGAAVALGASQTPRTASRREIPIRLLTPAPVTAVTTIEPWHILNDVISESPAHRINIALSISMFGHIKVLNREWNIDHKEEREIWNILTRIEYWNPHDRAPDYVTLQEDYRPAMPKAALLNCSKSKHPSNKIEHRIQVKGDARKFWLDVPVATFGDLQVIERSEIEALRSISNLLRVHRQHSTVVAARKRSPKPISIAVFGSPGTGKSFAVKQIADTVGTKQEIPHLEFNVAQFSTPADLSAALTEVSAKSGAKDGRLVTPLVFFDEFDCDLAGEPLGWLKCFLAPMQDGKLANGQTDIGPAIFVFAGGLHTTFDKFDPRTDPTYDNQRDSEEYRIRSSRFTMHKGPDFISRLRGHINILPINDLPGRPKHFVRRALLLRSLLRLNGFVKDEESEIDPAVAYALLTADRFHHGARSMQAILEMCSPIYNRIEIASLPPRAQLDMHVDATEFMIRVHRGRERSDSSWLYSPSAS